MRSTRPLGLALIAVSLSGLAAIAPQGSAATTFTWEQRPVADNSDFTEPSISVREDGYIVVCAPGGGNAYWLSADGGKSFERTSTDGFGGDCEIQFLDDGTLVSSDLAVTTSKINISKDGGKTWEPGEDAGPEQDRQWFAYHDGVLYNVYHSITHEYEFFVKSEDGGKTWSPPYPINSPDQLTGKPSAAGAKPGDSASPVDQGYNTFSGPMVIDPDSGDMYVAWSLSDAQSNVSSGHGFGPTRGIVVAHSAGGGQIGTWTNRYAVVSTSLDPREGDVNGAIFPWITIDQAGTVYVLFNSNRGGHFHTYYTYSTDKTATWSEPVKVDGNPMDQGSTVFVTGQAGAPGVLDVAWLESDTGADPDDGESVWHVEFAQVRDASSASPQISRSRVSDHVIHNGQICTMGIVCATGGDRSLGDFFELTIGPDGMAQMAWADNGAEGEPQRVWWAKQTSGPSAYAAPAAPPAPTNPNPPAPTTPRPPAPAPQPPAGPLPATGAPDWVATVALVVLGAAGVGLVARRRRG